jgi:transporter family protein
VVDGELRQVGAGLTCTLGGQGRLVWLKEGHCVASSWVFWALMSAVFAALTAIFGKIGVAQVNSDFATLLRTGVVLLSLALIVYATRQYQPLSSISPKSYLFLVLSGLATGASWICYFRALKMGNASLVAPVDKLSVVLVAIFGVLLLGEKLTLRQWCGIGAIGFGVVLLALKP